MKSMPGFQSSPGPCEPGVGAARRPPSQASWFQSSPGPCEPGVSAPRAKSPWIRRFNPRPALASRASAAARVVRPGAAVSILARPLRAGRHTYVGLVFADTSFQSSPGPCEPGVLMQVVDEINMRLFQSSPGPCEPGVEPIRAVAVAFCCFNPRPALASRASHRHDACFRAMDGFNPRPALASRASFSLPCWPPFSVLVSILARPLRAGRQCLPDRSEASPHRFNPRPALASRASFASQMANTSSAPFQSSPGPCEPGVTDERIDSRHLDQFQSSPGPCEPGVFRGRRTGA